MVVLQPCNFNTSHHYVIKCIPVIDKIKSLNIIFLILECEILYAHVLLLKLYMDFVYWCNNILIVIYWDIICNKKTLEKLFGELFTYSLTRHIVNLIQLWNYCQLLTIFQPLFNFIKCWSLMFLLQYIHTLIISMNLKQWFIA